MVSGASQAIAGGYNYKVGNLLRQGGVERLITIGIWIFR